MCTMGYWGRFQPIFKGELGFASLTQPGNGTGQFHSTTTPGLWEAAWNTTLGGIGGREWTTPTKPSQIFTAVSPTRTTP